MYWLKEILEDENGTSYVMNYYEIIPQDYIMTLVTSTGSFPSYEAFLEYYDKNKRL